MKGKKGGRHTKKRETGQRERTPREGTRERKSVQAQAGRQQESKAQGEPNGRAPDATDKTSKAGPDAEARRKTACEQTKGRAPHECTRHHKQGKMGKRDAGKDTRKRRANRRRECSPQQSTDKARPHRKEPVPNEEQHTQKGEGKAKGHRQERRDLARDGSRGTRKKGGGGQTPGRLRTNLNPRRQRSRPQRNRARPRSPATSTTRDATQTGAK